MKKVFLTLFVAAFALVGCTNYNTATTDSEATEATTTEVKGGDIAYVRAEYVLAESDIYKSEGVALQEKTTKAQNAWAQREKNLQYEANQLQEKYQKGLMTTADFQQKGQALEKRIANFQNNTQKEAQTLEEESFVFNNRMNDLLMRAIKEINADKKYKLVVNATALLDADESLDISADVLAKVNELYVAEKAGKAESKE